MVEIGNAFRGINIHSLTKGRVLFAGFHLSLLLFGIGLLWVVDFIYLFLVTLSVYLWDGIL